jgi:two-component system sporulation sensor kinase B
MPPTASTLFGLTLVVAGLIAVLVVAVFRLRAAAKAAVGSRDRLSEEAFMATAIQEALKQKAASSHGTVPEAAAAPAGDDKSVEALVAERVSHLAAGLAHELANSLTALHGYSRMIDMSSLSDIDRSSLEAVQEETTIMSETLDAFRRIVRPPELTRDLFELRHLVEDAVAFVENEAQLPRGTIARTAPPSAIVDGDRVLLEEAVAAVVRNAVEACRETNTTGTIVVRGSVEGARRGIITVIDRGPGVMIDDRRRLFEPFFSTKHKRAGFGLAFARQIVKAHGGTIAAAYPAAGGLEVTVSMPLAASSPSTPGDR